MIKFIWSPKREVLAGFETVRRLLAVLPLTCPIGVLLHLPLMKKRLVRYTNGYPQTGTTGLGATIRREPHKHIKGQAFKKLVPLF